MEDDISDLEPFRCRVCDEDIKNEKTFIKRHVQSHGTTWKVYVEKYVKNNNFVQVNKKLENEFESTKNKRSKKSKSQKKKDSKKVKDEKDISKEEAMKLDDEKSKPVEITRCNPQPQPGLSLPTASSASAKPKINVTDKNLKSCVRCGVDFESRLRFIRHCQLTHKMKFKLKNGDNLVLP